MARTSTVLTRPLRREIARAQTELARERVTAAGVADRVEIRLERTRIWRLYLRAARRGFDVGLTSSYRVLTQRPA